MSVYGIDLGTTFSAIATLDDVGNPEILSDVDNNKITASAVFVGESKKITVGDKACNLGTTDEKRLIKQAKKHMESNSEIFDVETGAWTEGSADQNTKFTPSNVSAFILGKLKNTSSEVKDVVITIPAMYGENARSATQEAAESMGLNVIELINEPTAAILHYAHLPNTRVSGKVMVFDLGGGTFDVTLANVNGKDIEVITSRGDKNLGGTDFDNEIAKLISKKYENEKKKSIKINYELLEKAERIKRILSTRESASEVIDGPEGPLKIDISRDEFESSISSYLEKIKMNLEDVLEQSDIKPSDISEILLVGGSTRSPCIAKLIEEKMGKSPLKGVDVDEAVASGAAIRAGMLSLDKLNPAQKRSMENVDLTEVSNLYLGTIVYGYDEATQRDEYQNSIIIERDLQLPCSVTKDYYTRDDNQTSINIRITQSEANETDPEFVNIIYETSLDLPSGRSKGQRIDVTYSYNQSSKIDCSFVDAQSGNKKDVTLTLDNSSYSTNEKKKDDKDPFLDFNIED